jgi:methionine-rich copper-binding protein CopC
MNMRKHLALACMALAVGLMGGRADARAWTPADLPGQAALWLDASDGGTITLNGSTVSQWNDKSPNGRNATQTTATAQPTYTAGGLNGMSVLTLDGANDYMSIASKFLDSTNRIIIAVAKDNIGGSGGIITGQKAGSDSGVVLGTDGSRKYMYNYGNGGWMIALSSTIGWSIAAAQTISTPYNAIIINGTVVVSDTLLKTPTAAAMDTVTEIGKYRTGGDSNYGAYDIGELIVTTIDTDTTYRQKLEGYLAWKWDLQASLPSDHPYKSAAPEVNLPTILSLSPADGDTNVPIGANLALTFDQSIATNTGNITLKNLTDNTQTTIAITDGSQVSVAGTVLTINPTADLTGGKDYAVRIDATAVKNIAGNLFAGIADDTTWNFTTDGTPPTVATLNPADDATHVTITRYFVATFSEPVTVGTGNVTIRNLTDNTQTTIAITDGSQVSVAGTVLTINPTADLTAGKDYAIRIDATAIKDSSGNLFAGIAGDTIWNFTTAPANLWTPADLPGQAALWLDASDGSTITLNGSTVSQWNDKSGNGRNATQGTAAYQPAYTLNSLPVLTFDGANDYMSIASKFLDASNRIIIAVAKNNNGGDGGIITGQKAGSDSGVVLGAYGTSQYFYNCGAGGWMEAPSFTIGWSIAAAQTITNPYNAIIINGTVVVSNTLLKTPTAADMDTVTEIGKVRTGSDSNYGAYDIGELIVTTNSPDATDRQKLEGYLAWKWGLQASLPSDHPYKSAAPKLPPPPGTLISFF